MTTRCRSQDMEDALVTQDSAALDLVLMKDPMPEGDNESSDKYCEEADSHHPLAELLEQFWYLKDQFASLKATTPKCTPTVEMAQLTHKLQHLTMMLQPHLFPNLMKNQCTKLCRHRHLVHNKEKIKPHHDHAAGYPHI